MSELLAVSRVGTIEPIVLGSYPDGMPLVRFPDLGLYQSVQALLLRPKSIAAFVAALFWVDALVERGNLVPDLILPFFPGARQDRLNTSGDYLFTAKSVAKMINARNFPSVTLIDPHSEVTPALVDRSRVIHAAGCLTVPPGKYAAVVSPDAGAEKRAGLVARKLGVPLLHAWKTRDVATGRISGFGMQPPDLPAGARVLVVDDICDGGGTFLGLADVIDVAGLRAHLFVTHGIFSQGTELLRARYSDHVYCTDSIIGDRPGVIEYPVCKNLLPKGTP